MEPARESARDPRQSQTMDRRVLSCRTIDEDPSAVSLPFAEGRCAERWGDRRGDRKGDGCCGEG
jgi:hypothetical protein